jgi:hypothetical protein
VEVVTWDITLLLYGIFNITIDGESRNAGIQSNLAAVEVTDLGVSKLEEPSESSGRFVALQAYVVDRLYNLGEGAVLPIEAIYTDSEEPAYNASIQVGDYGIAVVNGTGLGFIAVTSFNPGTVEIPISIKYDKKSGITNGTSNITVTVTFTSMEIIQANVSDTVAQAGQPVTFAGRVVYSHNNAPVSGGTITLDGELKTTTNEAGYFSFTHTESTPGVMNHTINATADGLNQIWVCSLTRTFEVEWVGLLTPMTTMILIGSGVAVVVVVSIVILRMKRSPKVASGAE